MSSPSRVSSKIAILLCTYQGQSYLVEQLESFMSQSHSNWELWVSDDGSQDDTHQILDTYIEKWGSDRISVHNGPKEGFCANFLSLSCNANIQADFYAYSDQDDIWSKDKLKRAVEVLENIPSHIPALYCSRTRVVDEKDKHICFSPKFTKKPSFANALMQNIGGGNTMVFNNAARKLIMDAGEKLNLVTHDWWSYILISGCGGQVFYDSVPTVRYRQHTGNLVGMNSSFQARFVRIRMLLHGRFVEWNNMHITALMTIQGMLKPENQIKLEEFSAARKMWLLPRLIGFKKSGVYRQTFLGNLGLFIGVILNKI